jgi:hypothetical protein
VVTVFPKDGLAKATAVSHLAFDALVEIQFIEHVE